MRKLLKLLKGLIEGTHRGNCSQCLFQEYDPEFAECFCGNPNSKYFGQYKDDNFSCQWWGF